MHTSVYSCRGGPLSCPAGGDARRLARPRAGSASKYSTWSLARDWTTLTRPVWTPISSLRGNVISADINMIRPDCKCIPEQGCDLGRSKTAAAWACERDHIDCLRFIHENGYPWDESICLLAAGNGHLECLKYIHENGCPWNEHICRIAAGNGRLECLQYAHENDCPWDEDTCSRAATRGHLNCLIYAHENGCPWDEYTCHVTLKYNRIRCLIYAYENRCPGYEKYHYKVKNILLKKNISLLVILHRLKVYARRFLQRYYSPTGNGYLKAMNRFSQIVNEK